MSSDGHRAPSSILAAKIPQIVYEQLSNDFLPAAKNVGQAGINLLKSYNQLQDALSFYCEATHKLIKSADTAGPNSRQEAAQLSLIFKEFVKGVKSHQKIITDFETLAVKIQEYSSKDKEKMKMEYNDFRKKEKKMQKKKHGETEKDISEFYKKEAANWSRQQELRYKFFNEKLHNWIEGYLEIVKSMECFQNRQEQNVELVDTEQHVSETENTNVSVENSNCPEDDHSLVQAISVDELKKTTDNKSPEQQVTPPEETRDYSNSNSSVATTLDDLPSAPRLTNDGVTLVSNHKRTSIEITPLPPSVVDNFQRDNRNSPVNVVQLPSPVPVIPPVPAPRHEEVAHSDRRALYRINPQSNTVSNPPRSTAPGVAQNHRQFPGAVPVLGYRHDPQAQVTYTPLQNNSLHYRMISSERIQLGAVVNNPLSAEQMNKKKYYVDSTYVPGASPSHQPNQHQNWHNDDLENPMSSCFTPSQYGSILVVNEDFNALSGEQMTVNRGDKVVLLKCGLRGWVFVRDSVSNRTGWVPEPYVNP